MPYFELKWGEKFLGQPPLKTLRTIPLVKSVDMMAQEENMSPERALDRVPSDGTPAALLPTHQSFVFGLRDELTKQVKKFNAAKETGGPVALPITSEPGKSEWAKFKVHDGSGGGSPETPKKSSKKKNAKKSSTAKSSKESGGGGGSSPSSSAVQPAAIFTGTYSTIYKCTSSALAPKAPLICRIFQPTALLDPVSDPYLRILRHLELPPPAASGQPLKSEHIIATLGIFSDLAKGQVLLVQEWADTGNAMAFFQEVSPSYAVDERQLCKWAQQLHSAMSYLGSKGVAHRAIYPKHVLFARKKVATGNPSASTELVAKLSGFRDAIIYWDPTSESVIPQPCKTLEEATSFHAPEMFGAIGGGECFDPIAADVWSLGCTLLYMATRVYRYCVNDANLEVEIRNSIADLAMGDAAKYWLFGLLRSNTAARTPFFAIDKDPWFSSF